MKNIKYHTILWMMLTTLLIAPSSHADNEKAKAQQWKPGAGDPFAGKDKARICQGCHGIDGNSKDEMIPKLSGQFEGYIAKQMRNYQGGIRSHEIMNGMAAPLSDKDLDDISAYFSNQRRMKGNGSTNARGKELFLRGDIKNNVMSCVFCHGGGGKGIDHNISMYPVIGGQHKAYLLKTLKDFRGDDRYNSPNTVMNTYVRSLSDEDLEALADYISAQ